MYFIIDFALTLFGAVFVTDNTDRMNLFIEFVCDIA